MSMHLCRLCNLVRGGPHLHLTHRAFVDTLLKHDMTATQCRYRDVGFNDDKEMKGGCRAFAEPHRKRETKLKVHADSSTHSQAITTAHRPPTLQNARLAHSSRRPSCIQALCALEKCVHPKPVCIKSCVPTALTPAALPMTCLTARWTNQSQRCAGDAMTMRAAAAAAAQQQEKHTRGHASSSSSGRQRRHTCKFGLS